jgi:DNA-directed RNA polymerase subunit RPC12/RpoP
MFCPSCGKSIPDESSFCLHCGTRVPQQSTAQLGSITATHSQQSGIRCPRCGQMDFVQKVESVADGGTATFQSSSGSGQSTTDLARHFALPDMPKDHSLFNNKGILPDLRERVEWRIKRYRRSFLYYCHRDHIVFISGQDMIIEPSEVQSYLQDNIENRYCVIQTHLKMGLLKGEGYFVARGPTKKGVTSDIAEVKCEALYPRYIKKDSKSHAQIVRHLQENGWQLVETEFKPAPWFEWLFFKG